MWKEFIYKQMRWREKASYHPASCFVCPLTCRSFCSPISTFLTFFVLCFCSTALLICILTNLSYSLLPVCLHTNLSATRRAFLPLSLYVCQLGKVRTKWAECKQCPLYPGRGQPVSHSWRPATAACDVRPALPIHPYSVFPLFLLSALDCCIYFCFCRPFLLFSSFLAQLLATSHFFSTTLLFPPALHLDVHPSLLFTVLLPSSPHQSPSWGT